MRKNIQLQLNIVTGFTAEALEFINDWCKMEKEHNWNRWERCLPPKKSTLRNSIKYAWAISHGYSMNEAIDLLYGHCTLKSLNLSHVNYAALPQQIREYLKNN